MVSEKPEDDETDPESAEAKADEKAERIEREREQLLQSIAATVTDDLKTKVGYVLSLYPDARDSDVTLAHHVWKTFYPELIDGDDRVHLDHMFELPRQTTMTRLRAKIQNEYGLFLPSEQVANFRRSLRDDTEKVIVADKPGPPAITVHADESGKNQRYLVVASVWLIDIKRMWRIANGLREWQREHGIKAEVKFTTITTQAKLSQAKDFVKKAMEYSDAMSLKACTVDTTKVKGRAVEETLFGLYCELVLSGVGHEVRAGRVNLPRSLSVVKDSDAGPDALAVPAMERRLADASEGHFKGEVKLESVMTGLSHESPLLQLADLFAGAIGRVLNKTGEAKNLKDEFAAFFELVAGFDLATEGRDATDFVYIRHLG